MPRKRKATAVLPASARRAKRAKRGAARTWASRYDADSVGAVLQFLEPATLRRVVTAHHTLPALALTTVPFTTLPNVGSQAQLLLLLRNRHTAGLDNAVLQKMLYRASAYKMQTLLTRLLSLPRVTPGMLQLLLHRACKRNHVATLARLLPDRRVRPSLADLHAALHNGHHSVTALLLADDRVAATLSHLSWAVRRGHATIVQQLLAQPRIDPRHNRCSAVFLAILIGRIPVLDILFADTRIAAYVAAHLYDIWRQALYSMQRFLVFDFLARTCPCPPPVAGRILIDACFRGLCDVVCCLVHTHAVPTDLGHHRLVHVAVERGHLSVVKVLLAHRESNLELALRCAEFHNQHAVVAYLANVQKKLVLTL